MTHLASEFGKLAHLQVTDDKWNSQLLFSLNTDATAARSRSAGIDT